MQGRTGQGPIHLTVEASRLLDDGGGAEAARSTPGSCRYCLWTWTRSMSFPLWRWACSRARCWLPVRLTGWLPRWHLFVMRSATTAPVHTLPGIAPRSLSSDSARPPSGSVSICGPRRRRKYVARRVRTQPRDDRRLSCRPSRRAADEHRRRAQPARRRSVHLQCGGRQHAERLAHRPPAWAFDGAWYRWSGGSVAVVAVALAVVWVVPALRRSAAVPRRTRCSRPLDPLARRTRRELVRCRRTRARWRGVRRRSRP